MSGKFLPWAWGHMEARWVEGPFRSRPDEPEPVRGFKGWINGDTNPLRYRAHLVRHYWGVHDYAGNRVADRWTDPDITWGVSLCGQSAYPRRWVLETFHPDSPGAVPELASMVLCQTCEENYVEAVT